MFPLRLDARAAAGLGLSCCALLAPATSRATDAVDIQLTEAGPKSTLPIGSPYFLKGTVDLQVERVQPVFVRIGTKFVIGQSGPDSCAGFSDGDNLVDLRTLSAAHSNTSKIWKVDKGDYAAYVGGAWTPDPTPPASGATTRAFSVLVPSDPFFTAMGRYCMVVFSTKKVSGLATSRIESLLASYATEASTCLRETDVAGCATDAMTRLHSELSAIDEVRSLAPAAQSAYSAAEAALIPTLLDLTSGRSGAYAMLHAAEAPAPNGLLQRALPIAEPLDAREHPLGLFLVNTLVSAGALQPKGTWVRAPDLDVLVDHIAITGTLQEILVGPRSADAEPPTLRPLAVKTDQLIVHHDVSVREVLEFLRGRLRIGDRFVSFADLAKEMRSVPDGGTSPSEASLEIFQAAIARSKALDDLFSLALRDFHDHPNKPWGKPPTDRFRQLGRSLHDQLAPCAAPLVGAWGVTGGCHGGHDWSGYAVGQAPTQLLATNLLKYVNATREWPKHTEALRAALRRDQAKPYSAPVKSTVAFDQKNWVFSYLTPVIGAGLLLGPEQNFVLPYVAAQINLVPNSVNEPMWINRWDDWKRVPAIELGMVTGTGPWGQDNRFSGLKGMPGLIAGLGLRLLPYTSLSVGATFIQRRSSVLEAERSSLFVSPYVGANVQVNIPDLLKGIKGNTTTSAPAFN